MPRVDYLNDPNAPEANNLVPAVSAIVPDSDGRILLIRRTDNNYWSIPGGGVEPGDGGVQAFEPAGGVVLKKGDKFQHNAVIPGLLHLPQCLRQVPHGFAVHSDCCGVTARQRWYQTTHRSVRLGNNVGGFSSRQKSFLDVHRKMVLLKAAH